MLVVVDDDSQEDSVVGCISSENLDFLLQIVPLGGIARFAHGIQRQLEPANPEAASVASYGGAVFLASFKIALDLLD